MGFETSTNIFSPDGRLLQLERALISPQLSSNITFSIFENKMLLVFEKKDTTNAIPFKQIHEIYDNVYISFSGLCPDFFTLKNMILIKIGNAKLNEINLSIEMINDFIANILQNCSLSSNRPFGLQILLFGLNLNNFIKCFIIETDGNSCEFIAGSLGRKKNEVIKFLENMEIDKDSALNAVLSEVQNENNKLDVFIVGPNGIQNKYSLEN